VNNGVDTLYSNVHIVTLKSTTIGISQISSSVPEKFQLYNNYPNPFNPNTKIEFDVPKTGLVKIKIFDVQGREVEVLVNQVLGSGKYSVDYFGQNRASGIYFYTLEAENTYQVKKMVMIK
jgi:hypothetical protein